MEANPTRPRYEMASDAPLVLWDCIFPHEHEVQSSEERQHGYEDRLEWIYVGDDGAVEPRSQGKGKRGEPSTMGRGKWGRGGVADDVWEVWRGHKMDETLSGLLLDKIAAMGQSALDAQQPAKELVASDVDSVISEGIRKLVKVADFGLESVLVVTLSL